MNRLITCGSWPWTKMKPAQWHSGGSAVPESPYSLKQDLRETKSTTHLRSRIKSIRNTKHEVVRQRNYLINLYPPLPFPDCICTLLESIRIYHSVFILSSIVTFTLSHRLVSCLGWERSFRLFRCFFFL
jgi:hypothetical protein